jgi:hypothetical protein
MASIVGQRIADTDLYARSENGKQVSPVYMGDDYQAVSRAQKQASKIGHRSVTVYGMTYVEFGGQWYGWSFPNDPDAHLR